MNKEDSKRISNHKYYEAHREALLDSRRGDQRHYDAIRDWQLARIKKAHCLLNGNHCADCDKRGYLNNLDFHHVRGDGAQHRAERGIGNCAWQMASWILEFPVLAKGRITSLCHKCHVKAERKLRAQKQTALFAA